MAGRRRARAYRLIVITPLPGPADLTSLLVRVDYTDDQAWRAALAAASTPVSAYGDEFAARLTVVDDPSLEGVGARELGVMPCDGDVDHLFVADAVTMCDPDRTLLAVDRDGGDGRTFRVLPGQLWAVQNNLAIANMEFGEFASEADRTAGVFRGFE